MGATSRLACVDRSSPLGVGSGCLGWVALWGLWELSIRGRAGVSVCLAGVGLSKAPRLSGSGFALALVGWGRA